MPNILVKVPKGAFPKSAATKLLRAITNAAATAEQIPAELKYRLSTWVVVEEVEAHLFAIAGEDLSDKVLPCLSIVNVPEGVLDENSRSLYVKLMHNAFKESLPEGETRRLATSVILNTVSEGTWGGNGEIVRLADLAKSAGYGHLQHLVAKDSVGSNV